MSHQTVFTATSPPTTTTTTKSSSSPYSSKTNTRLKPFCACVGESFHSHSGMSSSSCCVFQSPPPLFSFNILTKPCLTVVGVHHGMQMPYCTLGKNGLVEWWDFGRIRWNHGAAAVATFQHGNHSTLTTDISHFQNLLMHRRELRQV